MAKKKNEKTESEKVTVFSKRLGDIICPDGNKLCFEKSLEVNEEMWEWLNKSFPKEILKIN